MPKHKIPRKSTTIDMTAMCDVAFLLLTFFILTTQFRPEEVVSIDTPSSISDFILPDADVLLLSVGNDGRVFFSMDGKEHRLNLINKFEEKYQMGLTDEQKYQFAIANDVGLPIGQLKQYYSIEPIKRKEVKMPGIPVDTLVGPTNELSDWIYFGRLSNPNVRIAVKGDNKAPFKVVNAVIKTLEKQDIHQFSFITDLEAHPNAPKTASHGGGGKH